MGNTNIALPIIGTIAILWIAVAGLSIFLYFRKTLVALWREPILKAPVLIIESDDWGPGPDAHAQTLNGLRHVLSRFQDGHGQHPIMALGIVLAIPDTLRMRAEGARQYRRLLLSDPRFEGVLDAVRQGQKAGVFALQLHGMEHYWPAALMSAAARDAAVQSWLTTEGWPQTEDLPAHLQSRWTDAARLPSSPLAREQIKFCATEEVRMFASLFGTPPQVVVPPTFVWDEAVEQAWAEAGVRVVVTPGRHYVARDCDGKLITAGTPIYNGQTTLSGAMYYIVRDDYFEPMLGHTAEHALAALEKKSRAGRPTLLEMHRCNFTRDTLAADAALRELDRLLQTALERFPHLVFVSTEQLVEGMRSGQHELIERAVGTRIHVWLRRVAEISRVRKLAWLLGLAPFAWLALAVTRPSADPIAAPGLSRS